MIFKYANFTIDVDVERTRAFYQHADIPIVGEQCGCTDCRNYALAVLKAPDTVLDALRSLGIDPQKPAETFSITGDMEEDGTIWYNGWYHICGTIVEGTEDWEEAWEDAYSPDPGFRFKMFPMRKTGLLHKAFPSPVIQLEIYTHLPYVLDIPFKR